MKSQQRVICYVGKDTEIAFNNTHNRYTRDKKKVKNASVSGTDTQSINDVRNGTSDMFTYFVWLDKVIQPGHSSSNMIASCSKEGSNGDEEESGMGENTVTMDESDCSGDCSVIASKTTGKP